MFEKKGPRSNLRSHRHRELATGSTRNIDCGVEINLKSIRQSVPSELTHLAKTKKNTCSTSKRKHCIYDPEVHMTDLPNKKRVYVN